ncbi:MAG: c-type cytochrome [Phototrophicaceae bacterium]
MKRILKIVGIVLGVLIVLLAIGGGVIYAQNNARLNKIYEVDVFEFEVPEATDAVLAEGERIFITRGCGDCHSENGGGGYLVQDPAFGTITSANITRAAYDYTADDYIRAIMYGVSHDGTPVGLMPSVDWSQMRAEEIGPLLAYLLQLPPVDNDLDDTSYGPIGHILIATNQLPIAAETIDFETVGIIDLEAEASLDYGSYLAFSCTGCHGADFAGAQVPGASYFSANLTPHETGLADWSLDDFSTAMRTGIRPNGDTIDPAKMPWTAFANFTDVEIEAMYLYLQSIPPVASE